MIMNILVAEDSQDLADTYKLALENRGHVVTTTSGGTKCIQTYLASMKNTGKYPESLFDAVLLDQQMPDMDGIDVAGEIQRANPKQRIIFITGYGSEVVKKLGDLKDKVEIMNKPVTIKTLISQIECNSSENKKIVANTKPRNDLHKMPPNQQPADRVRTVKQLGTHVSEPTSELGGIKGQLQMPEFFKADSNQLLDYAPRKSNERILGLDRTLHDNTIIKKETGKSNAKTIIKTESIVLAILVVLFSYAIDNYYQSSQLDTPYSIKTKYSIEDLQGQASATQYWDIARGAPLTVDMINPDNLSQEKINVIKEAILSTEKTSVNSIFPGGITSDSKSEYFKGWKGALDTINNTEFYVPSRFNIAESSDSSSQIVIFLSKNKDPDGYSAYTKLITGNSQILKSFITIYDIGNLSDSQLSAIARYEFGRALGLSYSSSSMDLMQGTIRTDHQYISECDISAIQSLYNGSVRNNVYCNT